MIQINNLVKTFEDKKRGKINAVDNISLEVKDGEIFGLLGTNGAGKTTTLRMLATILTPTSGTVTVGGFDSVKESTNIRQIIGFLSGDTNLYARLTGREIIRYYAGLNGMNGNDLNERVEELINTFDMKDFIDTKIAKLSTGQRQRVSISRAIVHRPQLAILDEPTSGLDPIQSRHIIEFIRKSRGEEHRTILFSTHYLREAETLCDRIAVIHNGKIQASGTLEEILNQTGTDDLEDAFFKLTDA